MKNILIGNLHSGTSSEAIRSLFGPLGTIRKIKLMTERDTGLSRGFAFVEMPDTQAGRAIAALDGCVVDGQKISVREGRPKLHRRRLPQPLAPQTTESRTTSEDGRALNAV